MCEVIKTFANEDFGKLRVVCIDNEFFLISKDLGEFLGYVNTRNTTITHVDKKDRKHCLINTSFGIQKMTVINKNGVYSLIYNVKSQRGKNARDWIIQNVIPELYENTGLSGLNYPQRNERSSNTNELKIWNYNNSEVRTVTVNNEPWWVLTDVCKVLEISHIKDTVNRLDSDEVGQTEVIDKLGRKQIAYIINESGLYSAILRSDKPQAKPFRKWVTSEVLPSIRKTGMYATDELLNNPDLAIKAFTALKEEREKNKLLTEENAKKQNLLNEISPKAEFAEHLIDDGRLITATEIAKDYGMTSRQLNSLLNEFKIQFKVNGRWVLHKQYADKDYAQTVSCFDRYSGAERRSLKWTYKGKQFLYDFLKEKGLKPLANRSKDIDYVAKYSTVVG